MIAANSERIGELWAALGKSVDPMRSRWDGMEAGDRRVLLVSSKLHAGMAARAFDEIPLVYQQRIRAAYGRMCNYAAEVIGRAAQC